MKTLQTKLTQLFQMPLLVVQLLAAWCVAILVICLWLLATHFFSVNVITAFGLTLPSVLHATWSGCKLLFWYGVFSLIPWQWSLVIPVMWNLASLTGAGLQLVLALLQGNLAVAILRLAFILGLGVATFYLALLARKTQLVAPLRVSGAVYWHRWWQALAANIRLNWRRLAGGWALYVLSLAIFNPGQLF